MKVDITRINYGVCSGPQYSSLGSAAYTYHYLQPQKLLHRNLPPQTDFAAHLIKIWKRIGPRAIKLLMKIDAQMKVIL